MHGKGRLRARVLEQAVGDGSACSLKGLLARLEQQLDGSVGLHKLGLSGLEQTGRAEQRRRMHIVTASMHAAVGRGERLARLFGNGQGIHVATKHDDRSGLLVLARAIALSGRGRTGTDQANDAGAIDERAKRDVHLGQARLDIRRGLREVVTKFGRPMQIVTPCGKLIGKSLSLFDQTVANGGLRRRGGLGR